VWYPAVLPLTCGGIEGGGIGSVWFLQTVVASPDLVSLSLEVSVTMCIGLLEFGKTAIHFEGFIDWSTNG
jgi:hypothetical protein